MAGAPRPGVLRGQRAAVFDRHARIVLDVLVVDVTDQPQPHAMLGGGPQLRLVHRHQQGQFLALGSVAVTGADQVGAPAHVPVGVRAGDDGDARLGLVDRLQHHRQGQGRLWVVVPGVDPDGDVLVLLQHPADAVALDPHVDADRLGVPSVNVERVPDFGVRLLVVVGVQCCRQGRDRGPRPQAGRRSPARPWRRC
jgi:hypothetical protein